jgi:inhibitor of KinA sporulation pathway (predicted exonuclease)
MIDKYFIALDLEMNCKQDSSEPGKIIQVGIAIGNYENYLNQQYIERSWFVNPNEDIEPYITELTGISNDDMRYASSYSEIHYEIKSLIDQYSCFVNPVVWGGGDSNLFKSEVRDAIGFCHIFGFREIDIKTIHTFNLLVQNKKTTSSLKSALSFYKMKFEGTPHRAVDDARNTLNLFFKFINRENNILELKKRFNEM